MSDLPPTQTSPVIDRKGKGKALPSHVGTSEGTQQLEDSGQATALLRRSTRPRNTIYDADTYYSSSRKRSYKRPRRQSPSPDRGPLLPHASPKLPILDSPSTPSQFLLRNVSPPPTSPIPRDASPSSQYPPRGILLPSPSAHRAFPSPSGDPLQFPSPRGDLLPSPSPRGISPPSLLPDSVSFPSTPSSRCISPAPYAALNGASPPSLLPDISSLQSSPSIRCISPIPNAAPNGASLPSPLPSNTSLPLFLDEEVPLTASSSPPPNHAPPELNRQTIRAEETKGLPLKSKFYIHCESLQHYDDDEDPVPPESRDHPSLKRVVKTYEVHSDPESPTWNLAKRVFRMAMIGKHFFQRSQFDL